MKKVLFEFEKFLRKNLLKFVWGGVATLFVCGVLSCEVGLGESVDTEPPEVSVTLPEADTIIREAFTMTGECSDEQGVGSISVQIKNTSSKENYGPFNATLSDDKKSWTCKIDPLSSENLIPDGTYEATVTAKDTAGRTSIATKSFSIDNTAPLLVLTRPSTKISSDGTQSYDTYGAEFDITGQVADDSNVDKLVVSIYSDAACTNKIRDVELNNVPPTIDLAVAKYNDGTGIYEAIYGDVQKSADGTVTAETKQFYCKITIYDEARHCPEIENDAGNSREAYYLYNDIYSSLLKTYKITEIYHMLNGSWQDTSTARAAESEDTSTIIQKVKDLLNSSKTDAGAFSLNPMNNPTYSLEGISKLSATTENEKYTELANVSDENYSYGILSGSSASFNFASGLDKSPLVKDSLGLYLTPFIKNSDGTYSLDSENKVWILKPYTQKTDSDGSYVYDEYGSPVYTDEIDVSEFADEEKEAATSYFKSVREELKTVGSYNYSVAVKMSTSTYFPIKTGTAYILSAEGIDENGNGFINSNDYGFYFQSSGAAPTLNITKIDDKTYKSSWYVANGKDMKISGTVTAEDTATITVTVKDSNNNVVSTGSTTGGSSSTTDELTYVTESSSPANEEWEITIPNEYFATTKDDSGNVISANYTVSIMAQRKGSLATEKQISVGYDVDGPVIEIASVLPYASVDSTSGENIYTVNGTFNVKVSVSDEFYKLSSDNGIVLKILDKNNEETDYKYTTFDSNFTLPISSRDKLADYDTQYLTIQVTAYDYAGNESIETQKIYLDQDTDKPQIEFNNTNEALEETVDGVNLDYRTNYPSKGTKNVFVAGAPISATVTDDDGIANIVVNIYKTTEDSGSYTKESDVYDTKTYEKEITSNPYPLSYTVPTDLGVYYAEIIATDTESGLPNDSYGFYFMVDSGVPVITVNPGSNGSYFGKKSGPIAVSGSVSGLGGLTIYREYTDSSSNTKISGAQPEESDQKYNWEDKFEVPNVEESTSAQTNTYSVVDKKGRVGTATLTYYVDNTAPKVTITNTDSLVDGTECKLSGTASDEGTMSSGVNSVWYKLVDSSVVSTGSTTTSSGSTTEVTAPETESAASATGSGWTKLSGTTNWNFWQIFYEKGGTSSDTNALQEGSYTLYVVAYDVAQNASDVASYDFTVDLNKPEVATSYKPESGDETSISDSNSVSLTENFTSFNFTASDTFGLAESDTISVKVTKDGTELTQVDSSASTTEGDYTLVIEPVEITSGTTSATGTITFTNQTDGTYVFEITAKDTNGKTTTVTRTIVLDTTAPTVEIISPDSSWITTSTNKVTINGSASDDSGVSAVYYKVVSSTSTTAGSGTTTTSESVVEPVETTLSEESWTSAGWTKVNGTASWKIQDFELSTGKNKVAFAAVDIYGNCSSVYEESFNYDNEKPTVSVSMLSSVVSTGSTTEESTTSISDKDTIFANSTVSNFAISVGANDNYSLQSLEVVSVVSTRSTTESSGSTTSSTETTTWKEAESSAINSTSSSWTSSTFVLGSANSSSSNYLSDGVYTITVTATDISGQTATNTFTLTVDTLAPTISTHTISATSDKEAAVSTGSTNDGTWHSSAKPTLAVTATDATSGISAAYYLVSNVQDGTETPFTEEQLKSQTIDSPITKSGDSFTRTLSLNEGKNYVYIKVEDNAGNATYYGANGSMAWFVDKTGPSITFSEPDTSSMLSSKVAQSYKITVADDAAGITSGTSATVTLTGNTTLTSNSVVSTGSTTSGETTYTISGTFSAEDMEKITDNSATLSVTLSDAVGNSTTGKLTLTFDNEAPTVTITNPPLSTVNGKITISGTSTDNVGVSSIKLYRTKLSTDTDTSVIEALEITDSNGTTTTVDAVLLKTFESAASYNWSYSNEENGETVTTLDTTQFTDGSTITLYVVATDTAKNVSTTTKELTIDQDADRPIISFTNASLTGLASGYVWHKQSTIYGTVTDDDGVEELKIAATETAPTDWSSYENIYDNGAWNYELQDGSTTLYFYVKDSAGSEFVTSTSTSTSVDSKSPKLIDSKKVTFGYKSGSESSYTVLRLKVDTEKPTISNVYFRTTEPDSTTYNVSDLSGWTNAANISSADIGGPNSVLYVLVEATDANGIKNASITLKDRNGTSITDVTPTLVNSPSETNDSTTYNSIYKIETSTKDSSENYILSGQTTITATVTDQSGSTNSENFIATIDNTAPTFRITSHSDGATVYGSEESNVIQGTSSDASKVYFAITKENSTPSDSDWTRIDEYVSSLNWNISFRTGTNSTNGKTFYSGKMLNGYLQNFGYSIDGEDATAQTVYFWIYGTDSLGNASEPIEISLVVDPIGDKPNVAITYPENETTVGGSIRITGTTDIKTNTVKAVYVQIDPSYDGTFNENWDTELESLIEDRTVGYEIIDTSTTIGKAIKAGGTVNSWALTVNSANELKDDSKNTVIGIRVYAVGSSEKISEPAEVTFTIDPNSPVISDVRLVQYETSSGSGVACTDGSVLSGTVVNSMEYVSGTWISGVWILEANATDDSGIKTIIDGNGNEISGNYLTEITNGYTIHYPIGKTTGFGTESLTLTATEKSDTGLTGKISISLNYDNTAPTFATDLSDSDVEVINSDGAFRLSGTLTEATSSSGESQSGFGRVAFYFTRTLKDSSGTTSTYLIDPMQSPTSTKKANRIDVSTLTSLDGLYYKTYTISSVSDTTITLGEDVSSNSFIRQYGIVKIMGIVYTITDISGSTVTLDASVPDSAAEKTAYFAIAQIVDHKVTESGTTLGSVVNDDGDNMVESVSIRGTTATWSAEIISTNIPDGSISINFAAFDAAGNVTNKTVTGSVMNNRPRIAGVSFGSDDNGDGSVSASELSSIYSGLYNASSSNKKSGVTVNGKKANGEGVYTLSLPESGSESVLKIRGTTKIVPEIVGGNDGLSYTYEFSDGGSMNTATSLTTEDSSDDSIREGLEVNMTLLELLKARENVDDGSGKTFTLTLWDNTEGTTAGTDSQYAQINLLVDVALRDTTAPKMEITPFYWNSSTDNSVYIDSAITGHIELENDLPSAFTTSGEAIYDRDPKVSGVIKLEGTASDNSQLKTLKVLIPGIFDTYTTFATFENGSWKYEDLSSSGITYPQVDSEDCAISNESITNADGHSVNWTLYLDTSKVSTVAASDVKVQVQAYDKGCASATSSSSDISYTENSPSTAGTTQTTSSATTGYYKMDIVPYITALHTPYRNASGLKDNNIRSASGKYSIIKGTTSDFITVEGFNLPTSSSGTNAVRLVTSDDVATTSVTTSSGTSLTFTDGDGTSISISNNIDKSGYLEVFTNGIRTLNNINENDSYGSYLSDATTAKISDYANAYNREADYYTTKNVQLTDDRYLRVFDMKQTPIKNGYYPDMIMNGDNPVFGYIDLNGVNETYRSTSVPTNGTFGYIAGCYQTQKAEFVADTGAIKDGDIDYMFGTIQADQVAFAKDEAGKYFYASVYNYSGAHISIVYDSYAENHKWQYQYSTRIDGWGAGTGYSGYSGDYASYSNNNAISLEATDYGNGLLIGRYQNLRMVTKGDSTSSTGATVYMAYYDDNTTNKNIIFRTFKVGTDSSLGNSLESGYYSNLSDSDTSGRISVGENASSYLDLGVTSDNHVIIVYYDKNDACLKLKYSSSAIDGSSITPSVTWNDSSISFPTYVGNYVSLVVDSDDHIHIAAFDSGDSDLMYFYLDKYNSSSCLTEKIDQANSVGQWTKVVVNSENKPYIAYYNSTETGSRESIKLAYASVVGSETSAGVDSNNYTTGNWEYMTVPAITAPQGGDSKFKNVNLGFDTAGTPVVGYLGTNIEFGKWLTE